MVEYLMQFNIIRWAIKQAYSRAKEWVPFQSFTRIFKRCWMLYGSAAGYATATSFSLIIPALEKARMNGQYRFNWIPPAEYFDLVDKFSQYQFISEFHAGKQQERHNVKHAARSAKGMDVYFGCHTQFSGRNGGRWFGDGDISNGLTIAIE